MLFDNLNKCLSKNPVLSYDEACIDIYNFLNQSVTIFYQYDECHKCNFQNLTALEQLSNTSVVAKTSSPIQLFYCTKDNTDHCQQVFLSLMFSVLYRIVFLVSKSYFMNIIVMDGMLQNNVLQCISKNLQIMPTCVSKNFHLSTITNNCIQRLKIRNQVTHYVIHRKTKNLLTWHKFQLFSI